METIMIASINNAGGVSFTMLASDPRDKNGTVNLDDCPRNTTDVHSFASIEGAAAFTGWTREATRQARERILQFQKETDEENAKWLATEETAHA